jgi:hypothetical protein
MINFKEFLEQKEKKKKKKSELKINNPISGDGGGNVVIKQNQGDQPDQTDSSNDSHFFPEP